MTIRLSDHFNYRRLLRFTFPSIAMMLFTSVYGMVDGFFVSNYVGKTPFAALNLIWPLTMVFACLGYMLGTGGTALVAKTLGEGDKARANGYFSMIIYAAMVLSLILTSLGMCLVKPVARWMGAEGELLRQAVLYGDIIMGAVPTFVLMVAFQPFIVAAERPHLGFWMTVATGCTNMVLDWLLIGVLGTRMGAQWLSDYGLVMAATATVCSQIVGCAWPLIFFVSRNGTKLRLGKPIVDFHALGKACSNGLSELVTNVALSLVSMIYNARLLKMAGEDGVSAYGVIMYVAILFLAIFFGYSMGSAPVISFHFGAENRYELKSLFSKSIVLQSVAAFVMTVAAILSAGFIARVFTGYDAELCSLCERAFRLYACSFLFSHFNIFASSFFTALNDGVTSATISFSRMLLFQISCVFLLPLFLGLDGIWLAMPAAEVLSCILSAIFYIKYRHKFGY